MEQTTTTVSTIRPFDTGAAKLAARDAAFSMEKAENAVRKLERRIKLAGGVERALTEEHWWKKQTRTETEHEQTKTVAIHERMFCIVYVLYNCKYDCEENAIRSMIVILGRSFEWCSFPILKPILKNNSFNLDPTGPSEVPRHRQPAACHLN